MCSGALIYIAHYPWIDISVLSQLHQTPPSVVLDDEGNKLYIFQRDQREYISLSTIPQHVQNAFIATEDRQFYTHIGLSWVGIVRSLVYNVYYGRKAQGASTITQQLVRLLFFDQQKTFSRKIKEQFLAIIVEQQYSKEQILELYLNTLYFGAGIRGINAAAQNIFGKHVSELSVEEGATLAGIVRSPARYCPLLHAERARKRRNLVLSLLHTTGHISNEEMYSLQKTPLILAPSYHTNTSHLKELIRRTLEEQFGRTALYTQGLVIKTTINQAMQETAEQIFHKHVTELRKVFDVPLDGSLVCLEITTGSIKALVGGYDYRQSQFNRATQSYRQLGSTLKPLIYAAALENGMHIQDVIKDEPWSSMDHGTLWQPSNVNHQFAGPITRAQALITSNNIVAIKTLLELGISRCITYIQRCGIRTSINPYPSLALGCIDVTTIETAGMFNVFANQGVYVPPHYISWVKDAAGKTLWTYRPEYVSVFSWNTCSTIISVLRHVVERWQNFLNLEPLSCEGIGKTGTTNDARTCRIAGSTPSWTTVICLGADDNQPLAGMYSTRSALPLWHAFNNAIAQPKSRFSYAPTTQFSRIDPITGETVYFEGEQGILIRVPIA